MFQNLRVTNKLALAFGLLVLLTLAMAGAGVKSLKELKQGVDDIAIHHTPGILYAGEWHAHLEASARHMRSVFISSAVMAGVFPFEVPANRSEPYSINFWIQP